MNKAGNRVLQKQPTDEQELDPEGLSEDEENFTSANGSPIHRPNLKPRLQSRSIVYLDYKSADRVSLKMIYGFLCDSIRKAWDKLINTFHKIGSNQSKDD